jgi:xanthine dehydrogenase YagS FAD-binding subunit
LALASVASARRTEDGTVTQVRLALGGVDTKPWRAQQAESSLLGRLACAAFSPLPPGGAGPTPRPQNAFSVKLAQRAIVRALHTLTNGGP